jgi:hypothetical protein
MPTSPQRRDVRISTSDQTKMKVVGRMVPPPGRCDWRWNTTSCAHETRRGIPIIASSTCFILAACGAQFKYLFVTPPIVGDQVRHYGEAQGRHVPDCPKLQLGANRLYKDCEHTRLRHVTLRRP